jgi:hypothetical protein
MHGGRELVREENVAEMEAVKGAANRDFEQRHSIAPEAGRKARKASVSAKRADRSAGVEAGVGREKNDAIREDNHEKGGQLDERRQ